MDAYGCEFALGAATAVCRKWQCLRETVLPPGLTPRCLSVEQAAAYLGIGEDLFRWLVSEGVFPSGLAFRGRRVWDRMALDLAVDRLSGLRPGPPERTPQGEIMEAIRTKLGRRPASASGRSD